MTLRLLVSAMRRLSWLGILLCAATVSGAGPLLAQGATGVVSDPTDEVRVSAASVQLRTLDGRVVAETLTDQYGLFTIIAPQSGTYTLLVRRVGFQPVEGALILQSGRLVEVKVELTPLAVPLRPVLVIGETATTPGQREFLSRRHLPWNYSFDYADIEQMHAGEISDVLRVGAPLAMMRCMRVYFDGRPTTTASGQDIGLTNYDDIPLNWVYGIEVYLQFSDIPIRYRDLIRDPGGRCGAILIWSVFSDEPTPTFYTVALGANPGPERLAFEVSWRRAQPRKYVTAFRVRLGEFAPAELFGTDKAVELGYSGTKRLLYGTFVVGMQGPAPLQPWGDVLYGRIALSGSIYGGEAKVLDGVAVTSLGSPLRIGVGPEIAIGARVTTWKMRPWVELRTGVEYVNGAGVIWTRPVLMVGLEFGGG